MARKKIEPTVPRFGIGEWYGRSFVNLTRAERQQFARIAQNQTKQNSPNCPFKPAGDPKPQCTKKGGICSLRLYKPGPNGTATKVDGEDGDLRCVCPIRFHQDGIVNQEVARTMVGTATPRVVDEVRFLQRIAPESQETTLEEALEEEREEDVEASKEDVGNIDNVLVNPADENHWCALELQAVYFSGKSMKSLYVHIENFPLDAIPFPDETRRPDYRSSGPKRLMPQLQIKVPTLRRWGKKMAVVVDAAWFRTNVIGVPTVGHLSNADIAWFIVSFDESTDPATIVVGPPQLQTLERAVEGLTGGLPVTLPDFQAKLTEKLTPKTKGTRKKKP